jgi:Zn finger protein HypA/HybF involved in hydrogenase expression
MHEVSLVAALVDAAIDRAGGRPASVVVVRRASTIPEDVLRQAFDMLVPGTVLERARLSVEAFEVRLACPCGFDGALAHDDVIGPSQAICPRCDELQPLPPTAELELIDVRLTAGTDRFP